MHGGCKKYIKHLYARESSRGSNIMHVRFELHWDFLMFLACVKMSVHPVPVVEAPGRSQGSFSGPQVN